MNGPDDAPLGSLFLIVPCFNEEQRLQLDDFEPLLEASATVLFVDDGSADGTRAMITRWCDWHPRAEIMCLDVNVGKGEAVRHGLVAAADRGANVIGYLDADLATPTGEILRMASVLAANDSLDAVLGSRVALLGSSIERSHLRHIQGRAFATIASIALNLRVYDTQCGAKIFRRTSALDAAIREPFTSRWIFDIELLARLLRCEEPLLRHQVVEMPLARWQDVPGSHLSLRDRVVALIELCSFGFRSRMPRGAAWLRCRPASRKYDGKSSSRRRVVIGGRRGVRRGFWSREERRH